MAPLLGLISMAWPSGSISRRTRISKTPLILFQPRFFPSWKRPSKQLKLLDFKTITDFFIFKKPVKEKKQTVSYREVKISTVSCKSLHPIEIASQELVSAQYMAPASGLETLLPNWLETYFLSSVQPLLSSAPLELYADFG